MADVLATAFFFACLLTTVTADTESFRALRFARNAASQTLRPSEGAPVFVCYFCQNGFSISLNASVRVIPMSARSRSLRLLKLTSRPDAVPPLVEQ